MSLSTLPRRTTLIGDVRGSPPRERPEVIHRHGRAGNRADVGMVVTRSGLDHVAADAMDGPDAAED